MSKKRFIYNGYLQIAELDVAGATETTAPVLRKTYLWDPMEPVATRILAMTIFNETGVYDEDLYYTHDLLKNTTALFGIQAGRRALYEYGPCGNVLKIEGNIVQDNPFRFSSEYADEELGLVYYNYRYYNALYSIWMSREPIGEDGGLNLYAFTNDKLTKYIDSLGFQAIDASLLGTGPTNSVGAATLVEPAKMAAVAGAITTGTVSIVSKETLQRAIIKSGVKVGEILKELKHRKGMWVCYVRGSTLPTKENKGTCCPEVIHGYGVGKTQNIAHEAAKKYASSRTPKGCSAKHESNNYKCTKW